MSFNTIQRTSQHGLQQCLAKHWLGQITSGILNDITLLMMTSSNFPHSWPFVRGIHRWPVSSPHKGQWRGALMFSLISARINSWANNLEAGDLRSHRAHYEVTVMDSGFSCCGARYWSKVTNTIPNIVTSYGHHGVSNHLDCLFEILSMLTTKKIPKLCITGHLWGESTGGLS